MTVVRNCTTSHCSLYCGVIAEKKKKKERAIDYACWNNEKVLIIIKLQTCTTHFKICYVMK